MSITSDKPPRFSSFDRKVGKLGQGISGTVHLYKSRSGFQYAVKIYHDREKSETRAQFEARVSEEYKILARLDHPNIISVFKTKKTNTPFLGGGSEFRLYMEAGSPNLAQLMRSSSAAHEPNEMLCLWKQVFEAVRYLHANNMCHRDLKLENLVFDANYSFLKVIDFIVLRQTDVPCVGLVGSPKYAAPETFSSITYQGKPVDIWSIGVIWYYFENSSFPWKSATHTDAKYKAYCAEQGELLTATGNSELVQSFLQVNPQARPTVEQLQDHLQIKSIKCCSRKESCGYNHRLTFSKQS